MHQIAVKMKLLKGFEEEYYSRHNQIWPELKELLKKTGINDYSIFSDTETNSLFSVLEIEDPALLNGLSEQPVMQRWWKYMEDIMETNEDHSPVQVPLKKVFYLP
jgi:L-rhamnose mutarotase